MPKPALKHALGIMIGPAKGHEEPDGDEGEEPGDGDEALHQACQELADVLGVSDDKYEDFSDALGAYVDAKLAQGHEEEE